MTQAKLDAYIFHPGTCRQAMEFYRTVFGGELTVMPLDGAPGKLMHAHLSGGLIDLMGSDGDGTRSEPYPKGAVTVSLTSPDEAALLGAFGKLSEEASAVMEIQPVPWGNLFGSLTDRFGIDWIFNVRRSAA